MYLSFLKHSKEHITASVEIKTEKQQITNMQTNSCPKLDTFKKKKKKLYSLPKVRYIKKIKTTFVFSPFQKQFYPLLNKDR